MVLPREGITVQRLIVVVACIAFAIGFVLWASTFLVTQYAPGFSESRFAGIRVGMTPAQVESILGRPLDEFGWKGEGGTSVKFWPYSRSRLGLSYHVRHVYFRNERVSAIRSEYEYAD